jgi:hypothetical protein
MFIYFQSDANSIYTSDGMGVTSNARLSKHLDSGCSWVIALATFVQTLTVLLMTTLLSSIVTAFMVWLSTSVTVHLQNLTLNNFSVLAGFLPPVTIHGLLPLSASYNNTTSFLWNQRSPLMGFITHLHVVATILA